MREEQWIEYWQEKLNGTISDAHQEQLNAYLASHPQALRELEEAEHTWQMLGEIELPEPSEKMNARFEGMMAGLATKRQARPSSWEKLTWFFAQSWQVGLASLVLGLAIGWLFFPSHSQNQDISQLSSEVRSMKEMMMLTMIERPKAQERIKAVKLASDLPDANEKVIAALVATLNQDKNVNVRLAALESLERYANEPVVRQAIVDALRVQDSPLVLVAISDVLVDIQEKSSIEVMKELKENTPNDIIRQKLDRSIQALQQS